jgi:hypothetical protein
MRHSVDTRVLQDIINYLGNKPYVEVMQLITDLQNDAKAIPESSEASEEQKEQSNEG